MDIKSSLRLLPSVERVLEDMRISARIHPMSREGITRIVREVVDRLRSRVRAGELRPEEGADLLDPVVEEVTAELDSIERGRQRRVINATGVILHTNLGRAVLGREVIESIRTAASGYVDLEVELQSGARTDRNRNVVRLLRLLTGVEDALVVNNNAAALMLAVATFAARGAVAVSRGELVEIGGSFRLPEILAAAAGRVIEVGTTNRTRIGDYERAVDDGATLLLKVHTSNYRIEGFTEEVPLSRLVELGRDRGVPVMYDQGSGVLYPLHTAGIEGEECIGDLLTCGVDLVSFSADKILGGPQAGVMLGRSDLVGLMRANHLMRAVRLDKLVLAGLERVLLHYWHGEIDRIPGLAMIMEGDDRIEERARRMARSLGDIAGEGASVATESGETSVGGGSYPLRPLPTVLVAVGLPGGITERVAARLRTGDPPIIVRVKGDCLYIDPRTVFEGDEEILVTRVRDTIMEFLRRE